MWKLSLKMIQMDLFSKEKQTHRYRKLTYGYQEETWQGGINQEFGINVHTLLYTR